MSNTKRNSKRQPYIANKTRMFVVGKGFWEGNKKSYHSKERKPFSRHLTP
jgi:hypothetical protein